MLAYCSTPSSAAPFFLLLPITVNMIKILFCSFTLSPPIRGSNCFSISNKEKAPPPSSSSITGTSPAHWDCGFPKGLAYVRAFEKTTIPESSAQTHGLKREGFEGREIPCWCDAVDALPRGTEKKTMRMVVVVPGKISVAWIWSVHCLIC